jgi:hypothetical protein
MKQVYAVGMGGNLYQTAPKRKGAIEMPVADALTAKVDSKWFDATLLKGKPRLVNVVDVNEEDFKDFKTGNPEKKLVLTLTTSAGEPIQQRLILNPTRKKTMIRFLGNKPARWVGRQVVLSPADTTFGGQTVDIAMPVQPEPADDNSDSNSGDDEEELF